MRFSPRYKYIAHQLHKLRPRKWEEWQVGDWAILVSQAPGMADEVNLVVGKGELLQFHIPIGDANHPPFDLSAAVCVWLPIRESDWLNMPEWNEAEFLGVETDAHQLKFDDNHQAEEIKHERILTLFYWTDGGMEVDRFENLDNPLEACAEAWLRAIKGMEAKQDG